MGAAASARLVRALGVHRAGEKEQGGKELNGPFGLRRERCRKRYKCCCAEPRIYGHAGMGLRPTTVVIFGRPPRNLLFASGIVSAEIRYEETSGNGSRSVGGRTQFLIS